MKLRQRIGVDVDVARFLENQRVSRTFISNLQQYNNTIQQIGVDNKYSQGNVLPEFYYSYRTCVILYIEFYRTLAEHRETIERVIFNCNKNQRFSTCILNRALHRMNEWIPCSKGWLFADELAAKNWRRSQKLSVIGENWIIVGFGQDSEWNKPS